MFPSSPRLGLCHHDAPGKPQQLLQPLDLHVLHRPPATRPGPALPLLFQPAQKNRAAQQRADLQQEEQLLHLCRQSQELKQSEEPLSPTAVGGTINQNALNQVLRGPFPGTLPLVLLPALYDAVPAISSNSSQIPLNALLELGLKAASSFGYAMFTTSGWQLSGEMARGSGLRS